MLSLPLSIPYAGCNIHGLDVSRLPVRFLMSYYMLTQVLNISLTQLAYHRLSLVGQMHPTTQSHFNLE